jgi:hypothetical protein
LLKKLFGGEKAARNLKAHLDSDQPPASDDSENMEPDPFDGAVVLPISSEKPTAGHTRQI